MPGIGAFLTGASLAALLTAPALTGAVDPLMTEGLIAAVVSPLTADGLHLNTSVVPAQAAYMKKTGVTRVYIAGTTGESLSLTTAERKELVEAWEKVAPDYGLDYLVHVGAESIKDVMELSTHAQEHGAIALGAMPSVFFKPSTMKNLGEWMEMTCKAAPDIPVYYYHIPSQTGVQFDMLVRRPPSLCLCVSVRACAKGLLTDCVLSGPARGDGDANFRVELRRGEVHGTL